MDEDWHHLIERIHKIFPELKENEFTKPSGKKNITRMATSTPVFKTVFNEYKANLNCIAGARGSRGSCQMNYPSTNSSHLVNCHVVDPPTRALIFSGEKCKGALDRYQPAILSLFATRLLDLLNIIGPGGSTRKNGVSLKNC